MMMGSRANQDAMGLIFDVQGHSVHDGPGTRTTVFLSGCPLHCVWCSNPEGLYRSPVVMHKLSRCQRCGNCLRSCPNGAVRVDNNILLHDREICAKCTSYNCLDTCYQEALELSGRYYSVDELMRIFQRDRQFWGSKGGVTFSGGEPLLQKEFIIEILKACKSSFIHTCVETTSCMDTDFFMEAMQYVDWAFTDIKHMDSGEHRRLTGVGNELILNNIRKLASASWNGVMVPRVPVIPGENDSPENMERTVRFIKDIGLDVVNLLPFHRLGESKYRQLGLTYAMADQSPPSDEAMRALQAMAESYGLYCFIGWETPF
ncbi:glycyl-radical enzyme activating protein [Desulfobotulus sp. H1]|uniref:Glycyl-radical enzyme activating protein n=1 Tax=Desulfobotulus pelophilus TaxID=2823377 RepID=A0ABT3NBL6_9BACT|nr:glycyl-radical enzyme activating protein [Desulfobotulus pelophilus]MCW7754865.1 glycyl-radical enzyme activating protein [Desulfobotulus pelophilus]